MKFCRKHIQRGERWNFGLKPQDKGEKKKSPGLLSLSREGKLELLKEASFFLCSIRPGHSPASDHGCSETGPRLTWAELRVEWGRSCPTDVVRPHTAAPRPSWPHQLQETHEGSREQAKASKPEGQVFLYHNHTEGRHSCPFTKDHPCSHRLQMLRASLLALGQGCSMPAGQAELLSTWGPQVGVPVVLKCPGVRCLCYFISRRV